MTLSGTAQSPLLGGLLGGWVVKKKTNSKSFHYGPKQKTWGNALDRLNCRLIGRMRLECMSVILSKGSGSHFLFVDDAEPAQLLLSLSPFKDFQNISYDFICLHTGQYLETQKLLRPFTDTMVNCL